VSAGFAFGGPNVSTIIKEHEMASLGSTTFRSKVGNRYRFKVYPLGTRLRRMSGIYVIAYRGRDAEGAHRHRILYVGNTEDFSQAFEKHPKAQDLVRMGANCICVQSDQSEESRLKKERDLVAAFNPAGNGSQRPQTD
jgi:hypothetical protein